jgi:putative GTP pyrophosphokinase
MKLELDDLDSFLARNRITKEDWNKADIDLEKLSSIFVDYKKSIPHLNEAAEFLAKVLQKCSQVHSVRWRVKDPEHLLEKIIRKRAAGSKKYLEIELDNYSEVITDLVGVRVLHLFKYEWLDIHSYILNSWKPLENVKAYIREGDEGEVVESYTKNKCDVELHVSGYRSIHYIISTQPTLRKVISEIQVRTIFEEGWSEIDHKVRYPNFSDNKLISYFLTIFNRLAGSADEMGTFVKDLTAEISLQEIRYAEAQAKHEDHLSKIEALANELMQQKKQNKNKDKNLDKLTEEIKELRKSTSVTTTSNRAASLLAGIGSLGYTTASQDAMDSLGVGRTSAALTAIDSLGIGRTSTALTGINSLGIGHTTAYQAAIDSLGIGRTTAALAGIDSLGLGHTTAAQAAIDSVGIGSKLALDSINLDGGVKEFLKKKDDNKTEN